MRCFFALELPDDARAILAGVLDRLRAVDAPVRWVKPENLHLTVKFLGDCEQEQVAALGEGLVSMERPDPRCRWEGLGWFPPRGAPRVVWAALAGDVDRVAQLAAAVEDLAAEHGFPREKRPFRAHVTLGRVKGPRNARVLTGAIERLSAEVRGEDFAFPRLALLQSELTPEGSRYSRLYEV